MNYKRISEEVRYKIEFFLKETNLSLSKIAERIGINKSSLSREIKANSSFWGYSASLAEEKVKNRLKWKKQIQLHMQFIKYEKFTREFEKVYDKRYYGVYISRLKVWYHAKDFPIPSLKTIFNWINSNLWIIKRKELLRPKYVKNKKRKGSLASRVIKNRWMRPYWTFPDEAKGREKFGYWELDLVIGKNKANKHHLLTFVERKSRFGFIVKIKGKGGWKVDMVIWELIKKYNLIVRAILTDNGLEFDKLFYLAYRLGVYIYYTDNYAAFQKGTNENYNGLIRRYFKKGTDFDNVSEEEIMYVQNKINNMPRAILDNLSADEVYALNDNKRDIHKFYIPENEPLFLGKSTKSRESNTSRNKFFKRWHKSK